jgi:membrane protein
VLLSIIGIVYGSMVAMVQKVEAAFNFVWHVKRPRSLARRLGEYTVVMIVGPAVAVVAMGLLASLEASDVMARLSGMAGQATGSRHFAPYVLMVALFMFVYSYMPNTRVEIKAAFVGALFGGVVWAATGMIFASFVVTSVRNVIIYAGFAIVIVALFWLHISWLILLLGAQLSFCHPAPEPCAPGT